ncbi:phytanoyl-CoA hydroxylase [Colletotrichum orchidophilum]|uniref:Phytanoyl-CoA hydroxylase n=1 Tax=Colletotrichum orchidophilum TaxID=1209926 RepID=A0A1G4BMH8_9PEZI|nr:phytanoyl-CoA hydroxylase [Colletotrichum orchidophilum]OHF02506.1 phytanoyl-CoA hydroxylase [Colletotrichum orchidophilum]
MPLVEPPVSDAPPTINGVQLHVNDDPLSANESLIPPEDVLSVRKSYFKSLAPLGASSKDGAAQGCGNHLFLRNFVAEATGWGDEATLKVKCKPLRNNTTDNNAIGVHYDQSFRRYGEPTSMTLIRDPLKASDE